MKFLKYLVSSMVLFMFMVTVTWALGFEAAIGVWHQNPTGDVAYKGDSLSLDDDLNYDAENQIFGRVKIDLPFINFYLAATPIKFEGDGSKDMAFQFGDQTFTASVPFKSGLELKEYDIGLYWGIPLLKTATKAATLGLAGINFDFGVDLRLLDFYAWVEQSGVKEDTSFLVPVPMGYLALGIDLGTIVLEGEGRGIAFSGHYFYDFIGRLKLSLKPLLMGPYVFVAGGYRYQKINIDDWDDVSATIEISGPFVEIGGGF